MQGLILRLRDNMAHVKKDMTPYVADCLVSCVIRYLVGMTPNIAHDITKFYVYRAVSSDLASSKPMLYYSYWFFLASLSGVWGEEFPTDKVEWPRALNKFYCKTGSPEVSTPQDQNGPGHLVSARVSAEEIPKTVPDITTVVERPPVNPSGVDATMTDTSDVNGLLDKIRALPDQPAVPDRLVAVERKVETLLSHNGDYSKHRATEQALAKTQKDVEALQIQIEQSLATIDSQSRKIDELEEENKTIRPDLDDFRTEVGEDVDIQVATGMGPMYKTISDIETNIRKDIDSKIREVEQGLGESINVLRAQMEKQNDQLSEQTLRISELERVAEQVVSKVASLFKRKGDDDPTDRTESKRQRT
ncbi:hypothetical protein ACHAQI_009431 [Fusarium lateritium]